MKYEQMLLVKNLKKSDARAHASRKELRDLDNGRFCCKQE